jgi:hypothetical protein
MTLATRVASVHYETRCREVSKRRTAAIYHHEVHVLRFLTKTLQVLVLSFGALAQAPTASSPFDPAELRMHLEFLASKELGGRDSLSPNFAIAARYLATRLQAYGYGGAAKNGSFFQPFDVATTQVKPEESSLTLTIDGVASRHAYGEFYNVGHMGAAVHGELVFVGYGISSAALKHDDYAGLNVRGKIAVAAAGYPTSIDAARVGGNEHRVQAAKAHGAVALIYLPRSYDFGAMKRPTYTDRTLVAVKLAAAEPGLPVVRLNEDLSRRVLTAGGLNPDNIFESQKQGRTLKPAVLNTSAQLQLNVSTERVATQNVVGKFSGSDPKLRGEYIAFSAHYDHLASGTAGEFYPGADDDGSGTSGVLAIAKAMAAARPRRSVLVIFHAGEELGLLGSKYNADFSPVIPLSTMVVNINMDMIGRSRPPGDKDPQNAQMTDQDTIYVIGADRTSKELHQLHERTNDEVEDLRLDYTLNDTKHPDQIFFRSDHWNYGKHGVPFIFYFDGVGEDYHQPSDTIDKIDYKKLTRVTRLAFAIGLRVANLPNRLRTDLPAVARSSAEE